MSNAPFQVPGDMVLPNKLGHPRSGYQTMSTIKGTLRHSNMEGRKNGDSGEDFRGFKTHILRALIAQQGRGKKETQKQESQGVGILPISLRLFEISLSLQRNICQKYAHIRFHCLPQNPPHLTILESNAQEKLLGLEFQISQVLCKSTKSVRIGARILVADSFL